MCPDSYSAINNRLNDWDLDSFNNNAGLTDYFAIFFQKDIKQETHLPGLLFQNTDFIYKPATVRALKFQFFEEVK